jgi:sulfatase modifying factor 1
MRCPNPKCGYERVPEGAEFCPECGEKIPTTLTIPTQGVGTVEGGEATAVKSEQAGPVTVQIINARRAEPQRRRQAQTAAAGASTLQAGATKTLEAAGITLVYVPAGEFLMGFKGGLFRFLSDESPQHHVYLDGYWIGRTEVTNAQYRKFVEAGGYSKRKYWTDDGWQWRTSNGITTRPKFWTHSKWNGADYPVVGVSWYEAAAFAKWAGARLPTEAEWEKAARGGSEGAGYAYAGSQYVGDVAWYDYNSGGRTHPVGQKQPNELGLYDMSGNVWEWAADWYSGGYYKASPDRNPAGPDSGIGRVLRGGSWFFNWGKARCASRVGFDPDSRVDDLGFRVAE